MMYEMKCYIFMSACAVVFCKERKNLFNIMQFCTGSRRLAWNDFLPIFFGKFYGTFKEIDRLFLALNAAANTILTRPTDV